MNRTNRTFEEFPSADQRETRRSPRASLPKLKKEQQCNRPERGRHVAAMRTESGGVEGAARSRSARAPHNAGLQLRAFSEEGEVVLRQRKGQLQQGLVSCKPLLWGAPLGLKAPLARDSTTEMVSIARPGPA